jgi:hypothetical protein
MNLTDADLNQFFASKLAPLQAVVSPFIPTKVDPSCESYFEDVFELEPLAALEPDFRKLAKELRATDVQTQKVSNFIYAMY